MELALIWLFFGIFSALIASKRNRSVLGWFLIGFLFGPFGLLFAFFMKDGKEHGEYKSFSLGIQPVKKATPTKETIVAKISTADELVKLSGLLEKGHITQEEFNAEKAKILST